MGVRMVVCTLYRCTIIVLYTWLEVWVYLVIGNRQETLV